MSFINTHLSKKAQQKPWNLCALNLVISISSPKFEMTLKKEEHRYLNVTHMYI